MVPETLAKRGIHADSKKFNAQNEDWITTPIIISPVYLSALLVQLENILIIYRKKLLRYVIHNLV